MENREWVAEHDLRCPVLLQEANEVASLYHVDGTPMGYLVDEDGRVASPLAAGQEALLRLAGQEPVPSGGQPVSTSTIDGTESSGADVSLENVTRAPARSRILRDGLPAGTRAPAFRLPRLDGGELALAELRGRPVLLVFSDPTCGPCNVMAPELEQVHRRALDLQVLMVGRGDPAENRAKAAEYGLTFPIVLQQRWEISRAYGMFATPIGYLIDEHGVIAAGVAVGADAILRLAHDDASAGDGSRTARSRPS